jgi:hypothetical protein
MAFNGNSLEKDPKTGFLQPAKNYQLVGFTGEKKLAFLELYKEKGDIAGAMKAIGLEASAFYNHVREDEAFRRAYLEVVESMENKISGVMYQKGKEGSFIHGIAWLRAHKPGKWGNKTVISHQSGGAEVDGVVSKADDYVDAEVLPPDEPTQP